AAAAIAELDHVARFHRRAAARGPRRTHGLAGRTLDRELIALIEGHDLELVTGAIQPAGPAAHELGLVADDEVIARAVIGAMPRAATERELGPAGWQLERVAVA